MAPNLSSFRRLSSEVRRVYHPFDSMRLSQRSLYLTGYPKHSTFGAPVGSRTAEGREDFLRYLNGSFLLARLAPHVHS